MKKFLLSFYILVCMMASSCMHHGDNIDITYTNSDHYYLMKAYFNKSRTRAVEEYMDKKIGRRSNMSFVNTQLDGTVALDNDTKFYIKKSPGVLKIKLDKDENSEEAYNEVRIMCEGVKSIVTK